MSHPVTARATPSSAGLTPAAPPRPPAPASRLSWLKAQTRKPGEASFFYWESHFRTDAVKVLPGEFFVDDQETLITTTLGSCIAACLWDRDRRIGGLNHFMLPDGPAAGVGDGGRYGAFAMDQLIGEMVRRGAQRTSMEAKLFGGGSVVEGMNSIQIGERNTQFALEYLRTERIPVVSRDVLDIYPRKVVFLPRSGKAMVKRLQPRSGADWAAQDRMASQKAVAPAGGAGGSIDLF